MSGSNARTSSRAGRFAWALLGLAVVVGALNVWSLVVIWRVRFPGAESPAYDLATTIAFLSFGIAGAVIASRHPRNAVGWLLLAIALGSGLGQLAYGYAVMGRYVNPGSLPGVPWAAWAADWLLWVPGIVCPVLLLFQLFPTGRPVSPRWRAGVWLSLLTSAMLVAAAFAPGRLTNLPVANPAGIPGARFLAGLTGPAQVLFLVSLGVGLAAIVVRYRRARGVERAQLQWVMFAIACAVVVLVLQAVVPKGGPAGAVVEVANLLSIVGLNVAITVAMTRYHLFDIGRVVRRTIAYSLLTAVLVGLYAAIVVGVGTAIGRTTSPILIAGATLVVAAVAGPARRRIQALIDRRFFRRRYDAERVLAAFSSRLRDELDLESLSGELRVAVAEAVQPDRMGVWIRGERA